MFMIMIVKDRGDCQGNSTENVYNELLHLSSYKKDKKDSKEAYKEGLGEQNDGKVNR